MDIFTELKIFVRHIFYWIVFFIVFSVFFFIIGLKPITIFGVDLFVPVPSENSISAEIFEKIGQDLLPEGVTLLVTNPLSAFIAQILLSMLLSFLLTAPFFVYKIITYLSPALYSHERKALAWSVLPIVFLFFCGAAYAYFFIIPATFKILYPYALNIGATPYFLVDEFMHYVVGLITAVGLMFLLPIFMILLSALGIIKPEFWRKKRQSSLLIFLILSAIITPDGTGITMMMLFLPLMTLYIIGYIVSDKLSGET